MAQIRLALTILTAPLVACRTAHESPPPAALPDCRALVAAAPADWPELWTRVHDHGESAVPALIQALREAPDGPGGQAAIHLLGELGDDAARPFLHATLARGTSLATESALALGRMPGATSNPVLEAAVRSRDTGITTRVAAAAALVDRGAGPSVAGFLEAVFLAASPNAAASTRAHGLPPRKTRWAHERYMLIEAIRRRYGESFGLDEDASWPALAAATRRMRTFLDQR